MLQLRETRIIRSLPERVAPGVVIPEEGIPLSYVKVDGETCVQPCTGAGVEIFAGVSLSRNSPPAALPMVVEFAYGSGSGKRINFKTSSEAITDESFRHFNTSA